MLINTIKTIFFLIYAFNLYQILRNKVKSLVAYLILFHQIKLTTRLYFIW